MVQLGAKAREAGQLDAATTITSDLGAGRVGSTALRIGIALVRDLGARRWRDVGLPADAVLPPLGTTLPGADNAPIVCALSPTVQPPVTPPVVPPQVQPHADPHVPAQPEATSSRAGLLLLAGLAVLGVGAVVVFGGKKLGVAKKKGKR
jgi:hypothetical protein